MVMETSAPSPQNVGREFVRQYYTLLNKAPTHLHRFYNNSSVFIHGGLDTTTRDPSPAVGQRQIHQRIQQLNFQDCHAKINQVDSQATLGDGVVVQVSGELSNAGQAMRRFTQTFVLAAQAPKQYYVHNDIFRYQDFGYPDEDEDEGIEGVNDGGERETEEAVRSENEDDLQQNQTQEHATITASERHSQAPLITPQQAPLPQQPMYYSLPQQNVHAVMGAVTINGSVHEDTPLMPQQPPQTQPQQPQQTQQHSYIEPTTQEQFNQENEIDSSNDQVQQPKEELQEANEESSDQQEGSSFSTSLSETSQTHSLTTATSMNSGPKTYANLVKSSPSSAANVVSPQSQKMSASPPPMSNLRLEERLPMHTQSNASSLSMANANSTQQQNRLSGTQHSQNQYQSTIRPPRSGPMQRDGDRRSAGGRPGSYHDSHQLFLGNLPHNASDNELRQLFERFGKVAELRVHSKANERGKGPQQSNSQGKVPNYGFITFEDSSVVTRILSGPPIHFPDEHGQKLNIEIKKPKGGGRGQMDGASRSSLGDGNMRPMGPQQQQRGPGGPGNMMRGGPGTRGMRSSFSRGNEGGRGGGGMRQPGNPPNIYPNRR